MRVRKEERIKIGLGSLLHTTCKHEPWLHSTMSWKTIKALAERANITSVNIMHSLVKSVTL